MVMFFEQSIGDAHKKNTNAKTDIAQDMFLPNICNDYILVCGVGFDILKLIFIYLFIYKQFINILSV